MSTFVPLAAVAAAYLNSSAQIAVIVISAGALIAMLTLFALYVAALRHPIYPHALTPRTRHDIQQLGRLQVIFVLAALPASVIALLSALDVLPTSAQVYGTLSLVFLVLAYACRITIECLERGVGSRR